MHEARHSRPPPRIVEIPPRPASRTTRLSWTSIPGTELSYHYFARRRRHRVPSAVLYSRTSRDALTHSTPDSGRTGRGMGRRAEPQAQGSARGTPTPIVEAVRGDGLRSGVRHHGHQAIRSDILARSNPTAPSRDPVEQGSSTGIESSSFGARKRSQIQSPHRPLITAGQRAYYISSVGILYRGSTLLRAPNCCVRRSTARNGRHPDPPSHPTCTDRMPLRPWLWAW